MVGGAVRASPPPLLREQTTLDNGFKPWNNMDAWKADNIETTCFWKKVNHKGNHYQHCVRPYNDLVSDQIKVNGVWSDCLRLIDLWIGLKAFGSSNFIDAGANVGACTMLMGATFPNINITSFEPNPATLFYLTSSLLANPDINKRVTLYPYGLGSRPAVFPLYVQSGNYGNSMLRTGIHGAAKTAHTIHVFPLDSAFITDTRTIRLMKMDVQGFENLVLAGAYHILSQQRVGCVSFEVAPNWLKSQNTTFGELYDSFSSYGYQVLTGNWQVYSRAAAVTYKGLSDFIACSPEARRLLLKSTPGRSSHPPVALGSRAMTEI